MSGLSQAIAAQFRAWGLTHAQADVAGRMLKGQRFKGLSHREIASLRHCSDMTLRPHATTICRKSGLSNRAQLTALFRKAPLPHGAEPAAKPVLVSAK